MPLETIILIGLLSGLTFTLAWAAWEDIRNRIIPHFAVFTVAGLGIVYLISGYGSWQSGLIAASILLVIGFVLFQFNLMGGGDVKLMAAMGLWTGLTHAVPFVFYTTIAGGVVALAVLIVHRTGPRMATEPKMTNAPSGSPARRKDPDHQTSPTVPYGVAIAVGGTIAVWQAALMEVL